MNYQVKTDARPITGAKPTYVIVPSKSKLYNWIVNKCVNFFLSKKLLRLQYPMEDRVYYKQITIDYDKLYYYVREEIAEYSYRYDPVEMIILGHKAIYNITGQTLDNSLSFQIISDMHSPRPTLCGARVVLNPRIDGVVFVTKSMLKGY